MRKILLGFIFVMTAVAAYGSKYYGFKVGGVAVTDDNRYNITGEHIQPYNPGFECKVYYNASLNTLYLENAKIERTGSDNRCIFNDTCSNLKVVFQNYNSYLSSTTCAPLRINANTTFTCEGTISVSINGSDGDANCVYITGGAKVTFDHATALMSLTGNTNAAIESETSTDESLEFHHSRVRVYSEGGAAIAWVNKVKSDGSVVLLRTGSSDRYVVSNVAQFTINQPNEQYSVVGYNDNISVMAGFETAGSASFDTSKKTFVAGDGTRLPGQDIIISQRIPVTTGTFPDDAFRKWVTDKYGSTLETYEIFENRTINVQASANAGLKNVSNWTGISYFHCLRRLWVNGGKTERVGLSRNREFYHLRCYNCQMTSDGWNYTLAYLPRINDDRATVELFTIQENDQNVIPTVEQLQKAGLYTSWKFVVQGVGSNTHEIDRTKNYLPLDRLHFPSDNLRRRLLDYEFGNKAVVYDDELPGITKLNFVRCDLEDLTGLENFPMLTELEIGVNNLRTFDLSLNPALTKVWCAHNRIKSAGWDEMLDKLQVRENQLLIYVSGTTFSTSETNDIPTIFQEARAREKNAHFLIDKGPEIQDYVPIISEYFPDSKFREYLLAQDYGSDEKLYADEALAVTSLNLSGRSIEYLTGIKYFPELIALQCYNNSLTALNLLDNHKLNYLDCSNNQLEELYLQNCDSLAYLACHINKLPTLILTKNTKLWYVSCGLNQLEWLTLPSGSENLQYLYCAPNKISGESMDYLIGQLPSSIVDDGFRIYNPNNIRQEEENIITVDQVQSALARGVTPYWYDGTAWVPYDGYTGYARGDLNHDGQVNVGDVTALYVALLAGGTDPEYDINGDGSVNTGDVSAIYSIILNQ